MAPPPPAAPSPSRFVFKKPAPKTLSAPSKQERQNRPVDSGPGHGDAAQFASIPRFSAPSARAIPYPPRSVSPTKTRSATTGLLPLTQREDVQDEDSSQINDDTEMLDDGIGFAEGTALLRSDVDESTRPSSPKRLKIDLQNERQAPERPPSSLFKPSNHNNPPPPTSSSVAPSPGPSRFLIPHASSPFPTQPLPTDPDAPSRPTFLRPPVLPPAPNMPAPTDSEPLPEAFSPHRKGQRFVPGGMAAELSAWVIETGQAAVSSRRGRGWMRGEDYVKIVRVTKVAAPRDEGAARLDVGVGPAVCFVEAVEVHEDGGGDGVGVRVMLVKGGSERDVEVGSHVGIRAPSWEIMIGEQGNQEEWIVGVDWKVLPR